MDDSQVCPGSFATRIISGVAGTERSVKLRCAICGREFSCRISYGGSLGRYTGQQPEASIPRHSAAVAAAK